MQPGQDPVWESVFRLLDEAFSDVEVPYPELAEDTRDHAFLADMRFHACDMSDEEYVYTLPWLLKDLVTHHDLDSLNGGGDSVLFSLCPSQAAMSLYQRGIARLSAIDSRKGRAIVAWLKAARLLPGFECSQLLIEEYLDYWEERVKLG